MKCRKANCSGAYEHRLISRAEVHGGETVVIENVPAKVCPICGETFFSLEAAEALEALRDELEQGQARPTGTANIYHLKEEPQRFAPSS